MKRRTFLQLSIALTGIVDSVTSCQKKKTINGAIIGASASVGHMMRDQQFDEPVITEEKDVVIVGGGVSGLSAARYLTMHGINNFVVLDLEQNAGGNAASGVNAVSAYPWGAHYIPTPNNELAEYLLFLQECNIITEINSVGLPVYNEYFLCFDPQDRLYINGGWQEGVVPNKGVPNEDKKQLERFLQLMNEFRYKKGVDGKDVFAIPVNASSKDEAFTRLDSITMKQWLQEQGFTSPYLHWYVNYCTRDDFGTPHDLVSAWAGIHYFASRKGKGANAEHHDVLTWPEGNGWLVHQLQKNIQDKLRTSALVVQVKESRTGTIIDFLDVQSRQLKRILAKQCILAVPQFVASRLLKDQRRIEKVKHHFHYMPWMVANLTVRQLTERSGAPASWDNVLYDSDSLGYVVATHEFVQQHIPKRNLTYYLPLTSGSPSDERKVALKKTHAEWVQMIFDDLRKVHPNIEDATEEVNIMIWGHAMVQPLPGMMLGKIRKELSQSLNEKIHFAHTDLAGISIFEEAFYQGLHAAKKVVAKLL